MEDIWAVVAGVFAGTLARLRLMRVDFRAYPSAPNGVLIHGTIGFVSAALGAVAVPALFKQDYVAVTFLAVAVLQLREVRRAEREGLRDLDQNEYVPRGDAYIDGLAKRFESRNYVALLVALATTAVAFLIPTAIVIRLGAGLAAGFALFKALRRMTGHQTVGDVAEVDPVRLTFRGEDLYVDDVFVSNVQLDSNRTRIAHDGMGFIISLRDHTAHMAFNNYGLRQAIVYEISRTVGVEPHYHTRHDFQTGQLALYIVPIKREPATIVEVIKQLPLLESGLIQKASML